MKRPVRSALAGLVAALLSLTACGGGGGALPSGTFAGSTAGDEPFVVEIGSQIKVNRRDARLIDRGVIEIRGGAARTTLTCKKTDDKGEELRCTVRSEPPQGQPITEVIDLMLL